MASNLGGGLIDLALNRRPTEGELVGLYSYRANWGTASLQLEPGGSFQETVTELGKSPRTLTGIWVTTQTGSNYLEVDLKPFEMVWDDDHKTQIRDYEVSFYKPRRGATYGLIDDDLGERFVRQ